MQASVGHLYCSFYFHNNIIKRKSTIICKSQSIMKSELKFSLSRVQKFKKLKWVEKFKINGNLQIFLFSMDMFVGKIVYLWWNVESLLTLGSSEKSHSAEWELSRFFHSSHFLNCHQQFETILNSHFAE